MLVLLPPSEGKASSGRGAPLKPESLSLPGLAEARAAVLDELVELCASDEEKAREVLGLSEGLRGEIAKLRSLEPNNENADRRKAFNTALELIKENKLQDAAKLLERTGKAYKADAETLKEAVKKKLAGEAVQIPAMQPKPPTLEDRLMEAITAFQPQFKPQ